MELLELISYLKETADYIEFSFYKNSSEIMGAISQKGIDEVLNILTLTELRKGVFECVTTWEVSQDCCLTKNVTIDMSGEMIYITETLESRDSKNLIKTEAVAGSDFEREYSEILSMLKSKSLNRIEKDLLTKVVAAFFN
ncbi:hypothetical protein [Ruminiclostridium cellobioparum]|jgi:hypothetical protein|uniref:hypothetical protein n=1 Tax=Ruminiclostridium cellobioparum TaxID=29355 RepID=UPI000488EED2|nr:hypothetical protein [Ruminiclostridium cellobioparum]